MASPLASFLSPVVHPVFVHFTTALFPTAALFATYAAWKRRDWAAKAAFALLALAVLATLATVVTGIVEHEPYDAKLRGTPTGALLVAHEWLGIGAEVLFGGLLLAAWRRREIVARPWFVAALWLGVAVVALGGWIGGRLVYEFGLGTPGGP